MIMNGKLCLPLTVAELKPYIFWTSILVNSYSQKKIVEIGSDLSALKFKFTGFKYKLFLFRVLVVLFVILATSQMRIEK